MSGNCSGGKARKNKGKGNREAEHDPPAFSFSWSLLNLVGLDQNRLTYRYAGRAFRLTDVEGEVMKDLLAQRSPTVRAAAFRGSDIFPACRSLPGDTLDRSPIPLRLHHTESLEDLCL